MTATTIRPKPEASVEAPLTLTDAPPRTLGAWAQTAMWGSFGVTLFGPLTGALVALSAGSVEAGLAAAGVGTVIGALLLGGSAAIGARLGTPSMVGLRGLLGFRGSLAPTALNIVQNLGWAMMEIIVISSAAATIAGPGWRWPFVILAGALTTLMAVYPLRSVKVLRVVMLWLVLLGSAGLFVMVLAQPAHALDQGGVLGFWPASTWPPRRSSRSARWPPTTRGTRARRRPPSAARRSATGWRSSPTTRWACSPSGTCPATCRGRTSSPP
mgnify:CR=1 FL=1